MIMKNNIFNDLIENRTENNTQKTNGDAHMKYYIDIMDKKAWKKLSKSHAYGEYAKIGLKLIEAKELAEEAKDELLATREEILNFEKEFKEHDEHIEQLEKELKEIAYKLEVKQRALDFVKEERDNYKEKCEELELQNARGIGKADAALKITEEIEAELSRQAESINADCEIRNDYTDELAIKAEMVDDFKKSIKMNNKKIFAAKRDIKQGFEVNRNKKRIRDIEAQNRYLLNQINGFNATINEFQNKKIIINKNIVSKKDNYKTLENAWGTVSAFLK